MRSYLPVSLLPEVEVASMSTPVERVPEHLYIGVNMHGEGPVKTNDPTYAGMICWCDQGADCLVLRARWLP